MKAADDERKYSIWRYFNSYENLHETWNWRLLMTALIRRARSLDRQNLEALFTSSAFMVTAGLTFLNAIMLANALGTDGRGAVAAAFGNTIVLGWAFQIGVPGAAAYFAKDVGNRHTIMSAWAMTLFGAIPLALLLIPFYLWVIAGDAFAEGGTSLRNWYFAFIALNLFNGPFLSAVFWLRGVGNTIKFNALLALPQLLITFGYFVLFVSGTMTVNRALASTFIMMSLGWVIGLVTTDSLPGRDFDTAVFKKVRSYSLRSWIGNLSFFVSLRVDQMVLAGLVSLEELGVYAIAAALSTLSSPIARGVAQAVLPFVRNAASDDERLFRVKRAISMVALSSIVSLVAIGALATWFVPFIFSDAFSASVRPLLLLLPGAFATDVTQVYTTALSSFDRPQDASKAQIAAAIATVIGLVVLLPRYGIDGAAITTSISYWVALLVSIFYWRRLRGEVLRGERTGHTESISAS